MTRLRSYGEAATMGAAMVVTLLCCILQCSHAKSVDVGGTAGWTSFDSSQTTAPNYGAWASSQKLFVGDRLVFRFATGEHNVWQMKSLAAYLNCDFSGATLLDAGDSGFYTWTATYSGGYYFSCDKGAEGVGTHCNYNQKLAILVSKVATPPLLSPLKAPSPSPLPFPPSPAHSFPAPTPIAKSPVHAPAPAYAPWTASVPAAIPSLAPTKPPLLAPSYSPILAPSSSPTMAPSSSPTMAPSSSPVLAPTPVPAPAPASVSSPVSSPFMSPSSGPIASTPLTSTPDSSSPPMPDLPEVPGGGPASDSPSVTPNGGVLLSVQSWSSLVHSVIALLCMLLW